VTAVLVASIATMRANQLRLWFASFAYVRLCALRYRALFAKAAVSGFAPNNPGRSPGSAGEAAKV
jgi:hypothetical protein